jgi:hypothetical protein
MIFRGALISIGDALTQARVGAIIKVKYREHPEGIKQVRIGVKTWCSWLEWRKIRARLNEIREALQYCQDINYGCCPDKPPQVDVVFKSQKGAAQGKGYSMTFIFEVKEFPEYPFSDALVYEERVYERTRP